MEIDLYAFKLMATDKLSFSDFYSSVGRRKSVFYLDDIRLSAFPADLPHKFIVTDACSVERRIDAHVYEHNGKC